MRIDNSTLEYQSARIKSGDDIREKKILLPNLGIRAEPERASRPRRSCDTRWRSPESNAVGNMINSEQ